MTVTGRPAGIVLWLVTIVETIAMTGAGLAKFARPDLWSGWFVEWGYPEWMSPLVGGLEVAGALALLVPALAIGGAGLLIVIMAGALVTVLTHAHTLTWPAPTLHLLMLGIILSLRIARRRAAVRRPAA